MEKGTLRVGSLCLVLALCAGTPLVAQEISPSDLSDAPPGFADLFDQALADLNAGRPAEAERGFLAALELSPRFGDCARLLAIIHARQGRDQEALEWLERLPEWGFTNLAYVTSNVSFRRLRDEPRFDAVLEAMGRLEHETEQARIGSLAAVRTRRRELDQLDALENDGPVLWRDGHSHNVFGVRFHPDGSRLLSWGEDGCVRLWDAHTREHLARLGRHEPFGLSAAFSRDGERVLVHDRLAARASLWDGRTGDFICWLAEDRPTLQLADARWSPAGDRVVVALRGGGIEWFDLDGFDLELPRIETRGTASIDLGPRGERLLVVDDEGVVRLFDARTAGLLGVLPETRTPVRKACFAGGGSVILGQGFGHALQVWQVDSDPGRSSLRAFPGHALGVHPELVSPDGTTLVTNLTHNALRVVDLGGVDPDRELPHPMRAFDARFSPVGDRFLTLSQDGNVRLFEAASGELLATVGPHDPLRLARFSPDGSRFATAESTFQVRLYSGRTGEPLPLSGHSTGSISDLVFGPDGDRLVSTSYNGHLSHWGGESAERNRAFQSNAMFSVIRSSGFDEVLSGGALPLAVTTPIPVQVWSPESGALIRTVPASPGWVIASPSDSTDDLYVWQLSLKTYPLGSLRRVAVEGRTGWTRTIPGYLIRAVESSAGDRLFVLVFAPDLGGAALFLLDALDGSTIWSSGAYHGSRDLLDPYLPGFSPDGTQVVSPGAGGELYWWDERLGAEPMVLPGHASRVTHALFSSDGSRLITCDQVGEALVWDVPERKILRRLQGSDARIFRVALGRGDTLVATAGDDGMVRVYEVETGAGIGLLECGPFETLKAIRIHPDGRRVIAGGTSGAIRIFDLETGSLAHTLVGHVGAIRQLVIHEPGDRLLSSSEDQSARIWDLDAGRLLLTRVRYGGEDWLAFAPSGHYIGTPAAADAARVVVETSNARTTYPLSSYASLLYDPEKVEASLGGETLRRPRLPAAPELTVRSPRSGPVADRSFVLDLTISDRSGIASVSVSQDGVALSAEAVETALTRDESGRAAELRLALAVPERQRNTRIDVRAENRRGILSRRETLDLTYRPVERTLYVLALGVADYTDDTLDLGSATKDVDDLVARLVQEKAGLYSDVRVRVLRDDEVTKGNILRGREEFLFDARAEDTILVYVAGHGIHSRSGEYYFLTPDATEENPYDDGIERSRLESLVTWDKLRAGRRILILDTCHSGRTYGGERRGRAIAAAYQQDEVDARLGTGLYILAASSEGGMAEEGSGNGVFTRALLEGLAGGADQNGDGLVDIEELRSFASDRVFEETNGRQRPTAPRIEGGEAFPLARVPE